MYEKSRKELPESSGFWGVVASRLCYLLLSLVPGCWCNWNSGCCVGEPALLALNLQGISLCWHVFWEWAISTVDIVHMQQVFHSFKRKSSKPSFWQAGGQTGMHGISTRSIFFQEHLKHLEENYHWHYCQMWQPCQPAVMKGHIKKNGRGLNIICAMHPQDGPSDRAAGCCHSSS